MDTDANEIMDIEPEVFAFFDQGSNTFSYVVRDPQSQTCAVIDSVLDFDYSSGTISYDSADAIIKYIQHHNFNYYN